MADKELTGRIARDRIRLMEVPRLPEGIVAGFQALGDASGIVSDTLDELGLPGAIAASVFRPTIAGARVVGPALTVRNVIRARDPVQAALAFRFVPVVGSSGTVERLHGRIFVGIGFGEFLRVIGRDGRDEEIMRRLRFQGFRGRSNHIRIVRPHIHDGIEAPVGQRSQILIVRIRTTKSAQLFEMRKQVWIGNAAIEERDRVAFADQ